MSDIAREVLGRFPIDNLAFVFVAGFFMVISFPFDLFNYGSSGQFLSLVAEQPISLSFRFEFSPFVNMHYLGFQFPVGLIELILVCFPVGFLMFVLFEAFGRVNAIVRLGKLKRRVAGEPWHVDDPELVLNFYDWLRERGMVKSTDFLVLMRSIVEGILYGSETFFFVVFFYLVSFTFSLFKEKLTSFRVIAVSLFNSQGINLPFATLVEWTFCSALILVCSYGIYLASERKYRTALKRFFDTYETCKAHALAI